MSSQNSPPPKGPQSLKNPPINGPFDRALVRARRSRWRQTGHEADFLFADIVGGLEDRLLDVNRRFSRVLIIGQRPSFRMPRHRLDSGAMVVAADMAPALIPGAAKRGGKPALVCDEEALPFAGASFDLVVWADGLHHTNDVPGALAQMRRALVPDGFFIAAFPGGDSLLTLRAACLRVDAGRGQTPMRLHPTIDVRDAGALLQRAGFSLPVADVDKLALSYQSPLRLLTDLRAMGESLALAARAPGLLTPQWCQALDIAYRREVGIAEGPVPATFDIIYASGWAPSASQPKPLRRGSGTVSLADVLSPKDADEGE
ncbi:MAG: class I SAM-dependent methyltransferase [Pseudomonadota bacterium]